MIWERRNLQKFCCRNKGERWKAIFPLDLLLLTHAKRHTKNDSLCFLFYFHPMNSVNFQWIFQWIQWIFIHSSKWHQVSLTVIIAIESEVFFLVKQLKLVEESWQGYILQVDMSYNNKLVDRCFGGDCDGWAIPYSFFAISIRGLVNKIRDLVPRREAFGPKCTCACPGSWSTSCSIARSDLLLLLIVVLDGGGLVAKSYLTLVIAWTIACQGPLSMGFPRQGYWSELLIVFSFWNFRCCWEVREAEGFCDHWGIWHYMYLSY